MTRNRITVVLSQAQGKNPTKRALEESIVAALIMESGIEVSVIPYLYDLSPDHTGRLFLEGVQGDMVVLSWLYPRATYWMLDRAGIKGRMGLTQLKAPVDEEEEAETPAAAPEQNSKGIGALELPDRHIYCLDLRDFNSHAPYLDEIRRIALECRERQEQKQREKAAANPVLLSLGFSLNGSSNGNGVHAEPATPRFAPEELLTPAARRWYPVIDYSRCTNCMECLDFCLFGVYGVDAHDRILVESQDNCKRGCPACSRVCPEQAIMFPDYKSPAIAGAPVGAVTGLKIDLSRLFGGDDAVSIAASERDRELVKDGREAVGLSVGIPKRQPSQPTEPQDDLDRLMDSLDSLDI